MKGQLFAALAIAVSVTAFSQTSDETIPLNDMSFFRPQSGNWKIAGGVSMDPRGAATAGNNDSHDPSHADVAIHPGTGVLLNLNDEAHKDNLVTVAEHGDLDLSLEFMLPKGSNSGIYLQGRYEIQLFDSWGSSEAKFSDLGGIYRNWETEPSKIFMGIPPLLNASRAPGTWQQMHIVFKAPRFDANGQKTKNAVMALVEINGVVVHRNVEVPRPTGGPLSATESLTGPLMIQGDHGAVAFRNIRFKPIVGAEIAIGDLKYATATGNFTELEQVKKALPAAIKSAGALSVALAPDEDRYAIVLSGIFDVARDDDYELSADFHGGISVTIDQKEVIQFSSPYGEYPISNKMRLAKGPHRFTVYNFKSAPWLQPRLGLRARTSSSFWQTLTDYSSAPPDAKPIAPVYVNVGNRPRLLRAFFDVPSEGERKRLTHTIAVGDPSSVHYVFDLQSGALAACWRGPFLDATPMWHERGDGSSLPRGAAQFFAAKPMIARSSGKDQSAYAFRSDSTHRQRGYRIDHGGHPVFLSTFGGILVETAFTPEDNASLRCTVKAKGGGISDAMLLLATGKRVEKISPSLYRIDESFYIESSSLCNIRAVGDAQELVAPLSSEVQFKIIW